jgi:hypothetical protein
MVRKIILLLVVSLLLASFVACSSTSSAFVGTYTCTKGTSDYDKGDIIELKGDGSIYAYTPGKTGMGGSWEVKEGKVYITFDFMGFTARGQVSGDTMTLDEGSVWKK